MRCTEVQEKHSPGNIGYKTDGAQWTDNQLSNTVGASWSLRWKVANWLVTTEQCQTVAWFWRVCSGSPQLCVDWRWWQLWQAVTCYHLFYLSTLKILTWVELPGRDLKQSTKSIEHEAERATACIWHQPCAKVRIVWAGSLQTFIQRHILISLGGYSVGRDQSDCSILCCL